MTSIKMHHRVFWPFAYLATLALTLPIFWWIILIGGNPVVSIQNIGVMGKNGEARQQFRAGDLVEIRRRVCTSESTGVIYYPALRNSDGVVFPLHGGADKLMEGCQNIGFGFLMPDIPPGRYSYFTTIRFQNNLVGRDEHAAYPPLQIDVLP